MLLPGAPSELTPRPRRSEDVRVDERNRRHTDVRGCREPHRNRRSGPRPPSHANRYRSTASALACTPEASHSPTRMPRRHIRVSQRRFKFESRRETLHPPPGGSHRGWHLWTATTWTFRIYPRRLAGRFVSRITSFPQSPAVPQRADLNAAQGPVRRDTVAQARPGARRGAELGPAGWPAVSAGTARFGTACTSPW